MSTCISRHGEFGSHTLDDLHTCTLCHVLDEDALRAELAEARAEAKRLNYHWGETKIRLEGYERIEERVSHHIPEHYEAGYNSLEDWANDAAAVVQAAHVWRKRGRIKVDADAVDAAVEKIYPSEDYL